METTSSSTSTPSSRHLDDEASPPLNSSHNTVGGDDEGQRSVDVLGEDDTADSGVHADRSHGETEVTMTSAH